MTKLNDNFLNLLKYPLDHFQSEALRTTENAVIAAGAGSGKTQVLATRFAWLIMTEQAKVDQILTLTFTNKAAAEMYQRIYQTLYKYANAPISENLTEHQKQLAYQALSDFATAHIQTLDSYCASIVRQCANRYGIKPNFTTGSADSDRDVKNKALVYILQNAQNLAIQTYSEPGQLQTFAEQIFAEIILENTNITTPDGYFINHFEIQVEEITTAWNNLILGKEDGSIYKYIGVITDTYNASPKKNDIDKFEFVKKLKEFLENSENLFILTPITKEDIKNNSENLQRNLSAFNSFKDITYQLNAINKGKLTDVKSVLKELVEKLPLFESIQTFIAQYQEIKALNLLLDDFLHQVNSSKRTSGNLSFADVSELALKILLDNEDIRNQEKNSYCKIMIDEFQDNNGANRDLLYLLSLKPGEFEDNGTCKITVPEEASIHSLIIKKDDSGNVIEDKRSPDKLFFVGDEKQSIYKFRGADVSVFNELTQGGENKLVPMSNNYRSTPELLKAFNTIFKDGNGLFDKYNSEEDKKLYEAYYEKEAEKNGVPNLPELTFETMPISLIALNTDSLEEAGKNYIPQYEQDAYFIAKKIYELGKENKNWKDFAILDRSRNHRYEITKYLNYFGIPYSVDQQKDIFSDGIINDFYNFLRLCVYPSDINAFAAYMCSPLCGVSENAIEIILSHLNEGVNDREIMFNPLAEHDAEIQQDISEEDFNKFINGRSYFIENKKLILKQKLTTTISNLWHNKGYKYETMLNENVQLSSEHFDMLFELARTADENGNNVAWFIDQLDLLKSTYSNESSDLDAGAVSYPLERKQAVQIMTIHKSKGLEFDNVFIIGCTDYKAKADKRSFFFDNKFGVSIKPEKQAANYFALIQQEMARKKELAEFRRLIYVAITRAKKEVFILCNYNIPKKSSTSIFRLFENIAIYFSDAADDNGNFPFVPEKGLKYIPLIPIEYSALKTHSQSSIDETRATIIKNMESAYKNANEIIFLQNPIPRSTPSSLEPDYVTQAAEDSDSGAKFEQPADLLQQANFTAADFGTLVHSYLEKQALGISPEQYEPEPKLLKNLSDGEIADIKKKCIDMTKQFNASTLGQELEQAKTNCRFYRAEWAFRMFYQNTIFTGSIDLIYENEDGSYTIVDYKSDNQIDETKYIEQQHCYRTAAAKMLKTTEDNIKLKLFFLKHQKIIILE